MFDTRLSLSWSSFRNNLCSGLSALQQNSEFVDMTLAADGHHVKVHQLVMSLASPYIKDIITSTHCTHPVVFLNQISYKTLCSLLEYIYTGEVVVRKEDVQDLMMAAKALHIKGLNDLDLLDSVPPPADNPLDPQTVEASPTTNVEINKTNSKASSITAAYENGSMFEDNTSMDNDFMDTTLPDPNSDKQLTRTSQDTDKDTMWQYTVSNQGNLMIILNRFLYRLRYVARHGQFRRWQCSSHLTQKCQAFVVTTVDGVMPKRFKAHNHAFHDLQILQKVQKGMVFNAIKNAEEQSNNIKKQRTDQTQTKDELKKTGA